MKITEIIKTLLLKSDKKKKQELKWLTSRSKKQLENDSDKWDTEGERDTSLTYGEQLTLQEEKTQPYSSFYENDYVLEDMTEKSRAEWDKFKAEEKKNKTKKEVKKMGIIENQIHFREKGSVSIQLHKEEMKHINENFGKKAVGEIKTALLEKAGIPEKLTGKAYIKDVEKRLQEAETKIKEMEAKQ